MPKRPHKYEELGRTSRWKARHRMADFISDDSDTGDEHDDVTLTERGRPEIASVDQCEGAPAQREVEADVQREVQADVQEEVQEVALRVEIPEQVLQHEPHHEARDFQQRLENFVGGRGAPNVEEGNMQAVLADQPPEGANVEEIGFIEEDNAENEYSGDDNSGYSDDTVEEDISDDDAENFGEAQPHDPPLYDGAPLSLAESMLSVLSFVLAHNLTGSCLADLLILISLHCATPNLFKKTCYLFHKYFSDLKSPVICHWYCRNCNQSLQSKDDVCDRCEENIGADFFIEMPFIDQLRRMFRRHDFVNKLSYPSLRTKKNNAHYEDLYDGAIYKEFMNGFLADNRNISLMWNTDGISLFKSSKFSIWPFYLTLNELPPEERFRRENVLLAGLWFGPKKPAPNLFMRSFHTGITELYSGIDFHVPNAPGPRRVRGVVMCGTCDMPAKCLFLNMKQYNGYHGCPKCKTRGENSIRTGNVHVYPYEQDLNLRTDTETSDFAAEAFRTGQAVFGVKGPTVLSLLVPNIIRSTSIDIMHCVYLGVVKHLLKLWFDTSFHESPFSLSRLTNVVSNRLSSIKPPNFIQRLPRGIAEHLAFWKASELRSWFYYYSLPVLYDLMDQVYYSNYTYLVLGVFLLNQDSVSSEDILLASQLLDKFVKDFEDLYGIRHMSSNLHMLRHLPSVVCDMGPLWATSCFKFESMNGNLKTLVHGTRHAGLQIHSSLSLFCNLPTMVSNLPEASSVKRFCISIGSKWKKLKFNERIVHNTCTVGKHSKPRYLPDVIRNALDDVNNVGHNVCVFDRLKKDHLLFVAESYNRDRSTSSSSVKYFNGRTYEIGLILHFVKTSDCNCLNVCGCAGNYFAIIQTMDKSHPFQTSDPACALTFAHQCTLRNTVLAVEINHLSSVCFKIILDGKMYVIEPVNCQELE